MTTTKSIPSPTVAKSPDGSVQINFNIPYEFIEPKRQEVLKEIAQNVEVPGFRKGKAPLDKAEAAIDANAILERMLSKILPPLLAETIDKNKLKLAIYPKFSLIKANKDEDWQIRADTCELPEVDLGDYKKTIAGSLRAKAIWKPGEDKKEDKQMSREEKEQVAIKTLLESVKITIPKILLDEEVNMRLSKLLERLEKMGLNLEGYLSSISKTAESLRTEYEKQAHDAIALELILNKVSASENVKVEEKEIEEIIKVSAADTELGKDLNTPDKKRMVESILSRRKALDILIALA